VPASIEQSTAQLHVLSLCAGIGGVDLAFHRAGITTRVAVEIDEHARGVLSDRFPETVLFPDLTEVTADDLIAAGVVPGRTVLAAGWPCQGNSMAGRRGGLGDPRSGLWMHVARLLDELRPRWFVGENVPGLLSVNQGRDFGIIAGDLANLGMEFAWRVLDARHFGVPQRRRRLVVVGHLGDLRAAPAQVLLEPEGLRRDSAPRREAGPVVADRAPTRTRDAGLVAAQCHGGNVGPLGTLRAGNGSLTGGVPFVTHEAIGVLGNHAHTLTSHGYDASEDGTGRGVPVIGFAWQAGGNATSSSALAYDSSPTLPRSQTMAVAYAAHQVGALDTAQGGPDDNMAQAGQLVAHHHSDSPCVVRRLTPLECERLQGLPDGWTATSNQRPQKDTHRYRQLGNSVAVPVFEWVARGITDAEEAGTAVRAGAA
jgi:site-specific DNA-cytosine methylase